ncbi:MAG: hypothetical protein HY305_03695 [Sphingobacteriales bacterium]|nr:hypothetical protein [Sphingobacteriales bacterium]
MTFLKKIFLSCLVFFIVTAVTAQNVDRASDITIRIPDSTYIDSLAKLTVNQITIKGNRHTRTYIILREIQFKVGDSISLFQLNEELQKARQQIYNTTLFNEVKIDMLVGPDQAMNMTVTVKERWYIFPLPYIQLADRNLNEWLVKHNGDLSRLDYGIKFTHYNLSGRRDQLNIFLINGYNRNLSFSYSAPNSNAKLTRGFVLAGGFSQNKEIPFTTSDSNRSLFYKAGVGQFARESWNVNAGYLIRNGIKSRHLINLSFTHSSISDSVNKKIADTARHFGRAPVYYFGDSTTAQKDYLDITYKYIYLNVNNAAYPLQGTTAGITLLKRGFEFTGGLNVFSVYGTYNKYWNLTKGWYVSTELQGKVKLPFNQPAYINQFGLGYGDNFLRGQEYYVIDGSAYGIAQSTLKKKVLSFSFPFLFKSIAQRIPFTIFAKTYADIGTVYTPYKYEALLNNRFLYTGGIGIDVLTFYDLNFNVEYSYNQLGKKGLFLHLFWGL